MVRTVIFLLTLICGGQSQEIGPPQPVMAMVGDDIVLPCQLEPPVDAVSMTMEWGRPDLDPRFVYEWHDGQELLVDQNKAYKGRASLSINKLKHGDLSLTLSEVKISDNGIYRCYIPKLSKEHLVELLVGAVSSLGISLAGIHEGSSGVTLDCRSEGWYPEPEVFWLDGEGNLLSAGPTETVRGPDDLYTVSSRVTVEKRHSNSFICRVQQNSTNQIRETQIYIPGDMSTELAKPSCTSFTWIPMAVRYGLAGLAVLIVIGLVSCIVAWKRKRDKSQKLKTERDNADAALQEQRDRLWKKSEEPEKQREELEKQREELEKLREELEKLREEPEKLREELEKQREELEKLREELEKLREELEKQRRRLREQLEENERERKENKQKLQSVEKEITEREKMFDKPEELLREKEKLLQVQWKLDETKNIFEKQILDREKLLEPIESLLRSNRQSDVIISID